MTDHVSFSFGDNWSRFLLGVDQTAIASAIADTRVWIPDDAVHGADVLDIGSGSGLTSLAFLARGAASVTSFDRDPLSVAATSALHHRVGAPAEWRIRQGSILDPAFLDTLRDRTYRLVCSWGVLHHTGQMWPALDRAATLVAPDGRLWIAIYAKGPAYAGHLRLKQRYNRWPGAGKRLLEAVHVGRLMFARARSGRNPLTWNERKVRGMDTWHDIVDWLGGLPYEVASVSELTAWAEGHSLAPERIAEAPEGSCHVLLLRAGGRA